MRVKCINYNLSNLLSKFFVNYHFKTLDILSLFPSHKLQMYVMVATCSDNNASSTVMHFSILASKRSKTSQFPQQLCKMGDPRPRSKELHVLNDLALMVQSH